MLTEEITEISGSITAVLSLRPPKHTSIKLKSTFLLDAANKNAEFVASKKFSPQNDSRKI